MNNFNTENADADFILVFGFWVNGLPFFGFDCFSSICNDIIAAVAILFAFCSCRILLTYAFGNS